jgi:predicted nucleic acid-binding protein
MRCQNLINELKEKEKQLEKKQRVFSVFFGAKCNLPYNNLTIIVQTYKTKNHQQKG